MKKELALILIIKLLFLNNLYAYDYKNKCEDYLSKGKPIEAINAAKGLTNKYDSSFCSAKAKYYQNNYAEAIKDLEKSIEYAELQADQMYSMLYKGTVERDNKQIKQSIKTLKHGLEVAKLGNSKYMAMEQKFLFELGLSYTDLKDYMNATEYLSKSLVVAANDDERAVSYSYLAVAHAANKKYSRSVEFGLKAANTYQRAGHRNKYADAIFSLSGYHYLDGNTDKALSLLEGLESFAKDNGSKYYQAKSLFEKAQLFKKLGRQSDADASYNAGERISNQIGAVDLLSSYQ
jgi:tetratricopeptide (TPR) repeat protein